MSGHILKDDLKTGEQSLLSEGKKGKRNSRAIYKCYGQQKPSVCLAELIEVLLETEGIDRV